MSVVGVDFGSANTVIAVARKRGIDVIVNEVSNRSTPSLVGFGRKARYLGESAKTQEISNLKNTVGCLPLIAGRLFRDKEVELEQQFTTAQLVEMNGKVGAEVTYLGNKRRFSAVELIAMYLGRIKQTAYEDTKQPSAELVMSCPPWFTDSQRRCLIDAAEIAGWRILRLINSTTAAALGYGITKTDLPTHEERPRRVAFVDAGNSSLTCTIAEFRRDEKGYGKLYIRGTATDRFLGGRNFDKVLADYFAEEFKEKFKVDINSNLKARSRLNTACEKLKKILSANSSTNINIESIMNDVDVRGTLTRDEFESMCKDLLGRVHIPLEQALADSKLSVDDIDVVEMLGGSSRIPAIKTTVQNFFNKPLSFTLNADEAVARGCAFACAILSPTFRVREFSIVDICEYPIEFTWERSPDIPDEETSLTVFTRGTVIPSTKILTFYRKETFHLEARYADPTSLPGGVSPWIGSFAIKDVKPTGPKADDFMVCKLKTRLNAEGILKMEQAHFIEEHDEEPVPEEKKDTDSIEAEGAEKSKPRKSKKQQHKGELAFTSATSSLDQQTMIDLTEREAQMAADDKLVKDTEHMKNDLESNVYEFRGRLSEGGNLYEFSNEAERETAQAKFSEIEDWLFDDGDDARKSEYVSRLADLHAVLAPVTKRYEAKLEEERRVRAEAEARRRQEEEDRKRAAAAAMASAAANSSNPATTAQQAPPSSSASQQQDAAAGGAASSAEGGPEVQDVDMMDPAAADGVAEFAGGADTPLRPYEAQSPSDSERD